MSVKMDEIEKLEHLSLVSKVCTELDNHLSLNDKDLAEYIIHLAEKHPNYDAFYKAMSKNGADFSESFVANLLRSACSSRFGSILRAFVGQYIS